VSEILSSRKAQSTLKFRNKSGKYDEYDIACLLIFHRNIANYPFYYFSCLGYDSFYFFDCHDLFCSNRKKHINHTEQCSEPTPKDDILHEVLQNLLFLLFRLSEF
jgi:hypothetical protein